MIITLDKQPQVMRKITKAKLAKNGGVEIEFESTITVEKDVNGKSEPFDITGSEVSKRNPFPHEDLVNAFKLMRVHLALISEQLDGKKPDLHKLEDDEEFMNKFSVTSFSIGGSGESEGVSLSGSKKLKGGRVLNLNAPFTKFFEENDSAYQYSDELNHLISHAVGEVEMYLDGKIAPDAQQSIEFPEGSDGDKDELD